MKDRFLRWLAGHEKLLYFIGLLACALCTWSLYRCNVAPFGILLADLILLLIPPFVIAGLGSGALNKAVLRYQKECDPEILLHECARQIPTMKASEYKSLLLFNYYTAQHMLGEYQKALDGYLSLDLGRSKKRPTVTNFAYCNNLSDVYDLLGQVESANHWYREATEIYRSLSKLEQVAYRSTLILLEAQNCIRNRTDLDRALQSINAMPEQDGVIAVSRAITRAQVYLLQNRIDEARADLNYVIEHGNKLALVSKAKELLKGMELS